MDTNRISAWRLNRILLCASLAGLGATARVDAQGGPFRSADTRGMADVYNEPHLFPDGTPKYIFAILPMPTFGGSWSQAAGINNLGWVTGNATYLGDSEQDACIYRDGLLVALNGPRQSAMGTEINDVGEVAGIVKDFESEAGFWDLLGQLHEIPSLHGSKPIEIFDINIHGEVACLGINEIGRFEGAVYHDGEMTRLPVVDPTRDYQTYAFGINDDHVVVGELNREDVPGRAYGRAVMWRDAVPTELSGWEADWTKATDINDLGYIVGYRLPNRSGRSAPCIWTPEGETWELGRHNPNKGIAPFKINNRNQVLADSDETYFLPALDNFFRRLLDYYPPNHVWKIKNPNDLNDHGQIVGTGYRAGISTGWIATPVTPTFNLSSVMPGTVGEMNTIEVSAAPPGEQVTIVVSRHGGGTMIPGCTILDNALQLDNPRFVGTGLSDANGRLTIEGIPPAVFAGHTLIFQAFIQDRCEISNLVVQEF